MVKTERPVNRKLMRSTGRFCFWGWLPYLFPYFLQLFHHLLVLVYDLLLDLTKPIIVIVFMHLKGVLHTLDLLID